MARRKIPLTEERLTHVARMLNRSLHVGNTQFLKRIYVKGYHTKGERERLNILVGHFNKENE